VTFTLTVSSGASTDIPDGVYPVVLVDIRGPKTVVAQRGPKAGQEIELLDWDFSIDAPGHGLDGQIVSAGTSTASGPKSKMFEYLTALNGGVAPAVGASFTKEQLAGRRALATVARDSGGWPRIVNLGAVPATLMPAAAAPAPVAAPVAAPVRDNLPF
jgi:hypothetical protein